MAVTAGNNLERTRALNAQLAQLQGAMPPLASAPIEAARLANDAQHRFPKEALR